MGITKKRFDSRKIKKIYEAAYGMVVKKDHHIHHIDHDPTNNEPENLASIHKKIHSKYHSDINRAMYDPYAHAVDNLKKEDLYITDTYHLLKIVEKIKEIVAIRDCFSIHLDKNRKQNTLRFNYSLGYTDQIETIKNQESKCLY